MPRCRPVTANILVHDRPLKLIDGRQVLRSRTKRDTRSHAPPGFGTITRIVVRDYMPGSEQDRWWTGCEWWYPAGATGLSSSSPNWRFDMSAGRNLLPGQPADSEHMQTGEGMDLERLKANGLCGCSLSSQHFLIGLPRNQRCLQGEGPEACAGL